MWAWKNLLRRRIRSALTVAGVAVAVATLVAMVSVARGVRSQFDSVFAVGSAHLVVSKRDAADPFLSYLPEDIVGRLRALDTVAAVHPFLWSIQQIPSRPYFFLYGTVEGSPILAQVRVVAGRQVFAEPADRPSMSLGKAVADALGLEVGAKLEISGEDIEVVGIFESTIPLMEDGGLLALTDVQRLSGLEGRINMALVHVRDFRPEDLRAAELALEAAIPGIEATEPAGFTRAFDEFALIDEATTFLSVLAILVGGIGVMNTMLMSVFERTREFGILRAVGWSRWMILRQVLGESLALCLAGGLLGIALGVFGLEALLHVVDVAMLVGDHDLALFVEAIAVAIAMGLVGASYPALRAARITPIEALRQV